MSTDAQRKRNQFALMKQTQKFRNWRFNTYIKQKGRCKKCGRPMFLPISGIARYPNITYMATIDHKTPLYEGGGNGYENLDLVCWKCNEARNETRAIKAYKKLGALHKIENLQIYTERRVTHFPWAQISANRLVYGGA